MEGIFYLFCYHLLRLLFKSLAGQNGMVDQKALRILYDTYWSSAGWKREYSNSSEDLSYAQNAGYMFEAIHLSHDEIMAWLVKSVRNANLGKISKAFLASLGTRRLELRSALGSYAIAKNFPLHRYQNSGYCCRICGALYSERSFSDLNVFNFERYKWGGVRHEQPTYIAFDLEQFDKLDEIEPTNQDLAKMRQILTVIRNCEPQAKPRDIEKRLANVFESNKAEREILIQILGYCGILQSQNHNGYFLSFVNYFNRTIPPVNKIDWKYPVCWWRGSDGINQTALEYYFPYLV